MGCRNSVPDDTLQWPGKGLEACQELLGQHPPVQPIYLATEYPAQSLQNLASSSCPQQDPNPDLRYSCHSEPTASSAFGTEENIVITSSNHPDSPLFSCDHGARDSQCLEQQQEQEPYIVQDAGFSLFPAQDTSHGPEFSITRNNPQSLHDVDSWSREDQMAGRPLEQMPRLDASDNTGQQPSLARIGAHC
jgi:hypothetical protein